MDDDLKHKYAPRRNKRYAHLPVFDDLCSWAEALDWQHNDAHFVALAKRVIESTDEELREKRGMRVDQVANWDDLLRTMRDAALCFTPRHQQVLGIFIHLRSYVLIYLGEKFAVMAATAYKLPDYETEA